jgi:acyl dehydratase
VTLAPRIIAANDLRVGLTAEYEREIEESDVLGFAENSRDFNPLHVDSTFAQHSRFSQRIAHGAFQIGLASALIGMHLPGRDVLLGSVSARFLSPLYFPCRVRVSGEVTAWNVAARAGSVRVTVSDLSSLAPASEITMAFTLQAGEAERSAAATQPSRAAEAVFSPDRKAVILTGASGGIGAALLKALTDEFSVLALVHRHSLQEKPLHAVEVQADFSVPGWEQIITQRLGGFPLYGIVHCAWAGMPRGGAAEQRRSAHRTTACLRNVPRGAAGPVTVRSRRFRGRTNGGARVGSGALQARLGHGGLFSRQVGFGRHAPAFGSRAGS